MKNYQQYLNEASKKEPKVVNNVLKLTKTTNIDIPLTYDILFLTQEELLKEYGYDDILELEISLDFILNFLREYYDKMKMKINYTEEWLVSLSFIKNDDNKILNNFIEFYKFARKHKIDFALFYDELENCKTPNFKLSDKDVKEINKVILSYLIRDCSDEFVKFYKFLYEFEDKKSIKDLLSEYETQKAILDAGDISFLREIGFNKQLLKENPDLKKQIDWS